MKYSKLVIHGKYCGYTFEEMLEKYKKLENEWIRKEERYKKEMEEIEDAIKSLR